MRDADARRRGRRGQHRHDVAQAISRAFALLAMRGLFATPPFEDGVETVGGFQVPLLRFCLRLRTVSDRFDDPH